MQRGVILLPHFTTFPSITRYCMKKMSTTPSPVIPRFVSVEGGDIFSRSQPDGFRFRLVSYNILAQVYVKSSFFPHSPKPCLRWKARSQAILTVLKNLKADFLCLQEVDEYDGFYRANMEKTGYASVYVQRTGEKRDGCGIFYRQDRAELVLVDRIEYNDLVDSIQEITDSSDIHNDEMSNGNSDAKTKCASPVKKSTDDHADPCVRMKRDCVGILAAFRLKGSPGQLIIIANTHIYWDPEWADVKLAQAKYLLSRLARFRTKVSDKFESFPPVIVAGDFNSIPGDKVCLYPALPFSNHHVTNTDV
ncbi:hypothetical protein SAY87_015329 [Trapa incisa]|uniref:Endonuclease/exonuclease/phosphatase domain-containing protein n=1 Tax=Trapa incisa TaxID=236973 RepID=A0AAN7GX09_9MYRT|nr:hypothetical protein SAY87_015329 [Trapa incisa]